MKAGEVMARIDPRDYEAAVKQAKARLEDARLNLELEGGRQIVAKREWDVIGPTTESSEASSRLATLYLQQGRLADAGWVMERLVAGDPNSRQAQQLLRKIEQACAQRDQRLALNRRQG